jgi:hypothetical protein
MEPSEQPRAARRSAGEWLFQLTTITIGVLIALSFDAVLKWNADRKLVDEALATIALEVADNRRQLEEHLATFEQRLAKLDLVFKLMAEIDSGAEPSVKQIDFMFGFPSLSDAAWQSAERTGALTLLEYTQVQRLAQLYTLQSLVTENLRPTLAALNQVGTLLGPTMEQPSEASVQVRDALRTRLHEVRAHLSLDDQLGGQLLDAYKEYAEGSSAAH